MEIYQIINACLVMKDAVASIYSEFTQLFPEEKEFWQDLYEGEKRHKCFIIETADRGIFDDMQVADLQLPMPLFDRTRKLLENISNQINLNPVSVKDALKIALKIEETVGETFADELITNVSTANNKAFPEILTEGKTHIAKIKDMMIKKGFLKLS
jgi:hypothetical protein